MKTKTLLTETTKAKLNAIQDVAKAEVIEMKIRKEIRKHCNWDMIIFEHEMAWGN